MIEVSFKKCKSKTYQCYIKFYLWLDNHNKLHIKQDIIELKSIILSIKQGEESGLRLLYTHYSGAIYGIIHRILNKQEESEEVLQSVFLKIWNNIDSYNESKATLFTWMAQIARNAAIDMKRLKSYEMSSNTFSLDNPEYSGLSAESVNVQDIHNLLKNMPEKYKILLDKMFLQGYTQQEISDELDIPLGTVKTRLRDAIKSLRESLKNEKHLLYFFTLLS